MMEPMAIKCCPNDSGRTFEVRIFNNVPNKLDFSVLGNKTRCLCVVDNNVVNHFEKLQTGGFHDLNIKPLYLEIGAKSLDAVIKIWEAMVISKPEFVIAFGGGTTCDLSGFAASTYKRGIPILLFPTTLLAMTDVAISGKTGVDFANIKNSVGSIHYPHLCVSIIDFLHTLDLIEFRSALSEMVKVSVTSDVEFFEHLETLQSINSRHEELASLIETSCRLKAAIVEGPPNIRLHSLYGHVIGQAIECITPNRSRHGDCVAIGLNIEGFIATRLGLWSEAEWLRQQRLLRNLGLPTSIPVGISVDQLLDQARKDKHAGVNDVKLILPQKIGGVFSENGNALTTVPIEVVKQLLLEFLSL